MTGARQMIAVMITFRKSNKNLLQRRADACLSSRKRNTLYLPVGMAQHDSGTGVRTSNLARQSKSCLYPRHENIVGHGDVAPLILTQSLAGGAWSTSRPGRFPVPAE